MGEDRSLVDHRFQTKFLPRERPHWLYLLLVAPWRTHATEPEPLRLAFDACSLHQTGSLASIVSSWLRWFDGRCILLPRLGQDLLDSLNWPVLYFQR